MPMHLTLTQLIYGASFFLIISAVFGGMFGLAIANFLDDWENPANWFILAFSIGSAVVITMLVLTPPWGGAINWFTASVTLLFLGMAIWVFLAMRREKKANVADPNLTLIV